MTLKEMLNTVNKPFVQKLDDSKLKRLMNNLHLANTLSRVDKTPLIVNVQKIVQSEMYERGFPGVIKPKD